MKRLAVTRFLVLWAALFWVMGSPATLWAHKVTIFAWVDGDTVHTQSKFSGGKRAKNATVVVQDRDGNQLLEGKTDDNGEFSFKIPQKTDLRVILKASMGHLGEWTIPAEELGGEAPSGGGGPEPPAEQPSGEEPPAAGEQGTLSVPVSTVSAPGLNKEEVRKVVSEVLDQKLAPMMDMLADSVEGGPTLDKVIGGIGYILGIVGVALYVSNRKKGTK